MTFPVIRIEVEGIRERMTHALAIRETDVTQSVTAALNKAIDAFDFDTEVQKIVAKEFHAAISRAVEHYFSFGEGQRLIKDAVTKTLAAKYTEPPAR